jgi:hypothetical protein
MKKLLALLLGLVVPLGATSLVVPVSHPFLMRDSEVIVQTLQFLALGHFRHAAGALAEAAVPPAAAGMRN